MYAERILIVEDEPVVALDLRHTLEDMGHTVCGMQTSVDAALLAVEQQQPSLILMDINLEGGGDGVEACRAIYQRWRLPVIFLTAFTDERTVSRAADTKPFGYVMKPYDPTELSAVIQVARSRYDTELALAKSEERLAIAIQAAELGTWEWESQLDQVRGDERFSRMWGSALYPFQAGLQAMLDRVHPEDRPSVAVTLQRPGFFSCSFRVSRDAGDYAWLEMYGNLRQTTDGHQLVVGALRDITPRKTMEDHLRQASVVFNTSAEGILILDSAGRVLSANPAFTRLTGYVGEDVLGLQPSDFLLVRRDNDPVYSDVANMPAGFWSGEVACKCKDGRIFPALQHVCVVCDELGQAGQYVQTLSDISAIREAERQLTHLAYHDPLTGLGNRYLLDQRLNIELLQAKESDQHLAILFIDLDGFKAINDSMGHHVGDRVIQEAASRIVRQIRRDDEAIRIGGDEFVVVVPSLRQPSEGLIVADKIRKVLSAPIVIDDHQFVIGASIGVAFYPTDGESLNELLSAADSAMYEAKRQGKGRVCAYSSDLVENVRTRLNIEQSLYGALERDEFVLFYQPVVDLHTNRLAGFEALIRWQHPVSGLIGPDKFIPIAEETGLIESIGAWVLDRAAAQLAEWNRQGRGDLFMAINVSPRQFRDDLLLSQLQDVIQRYEIDPKCLEIEITESMLQDFHKSRRIVHGMRDLGVSVAIDDFGTGFSSLALLKHLPITRIKIDRSFVIALPGTARDVGLISAIMQMAISLELAVTAEGIETLEQAQIMRSMGSPAVQGYYFSRPFAADAFTAEWIGRRSEAF